MYIIIIFVETEIQLLSYESCFLFIFLASQMVSHYVSQAGIWLGKLKWSLAFQVAKMQVYTVEILMRKNCLYDYFKQTRFMSQTAFWFSSKEIEEIINYFVLLKYQKLCGISHVFTH